VFWSYLESNDVPPLVLADTRFPCQHLAVHDGQALPFRVRAFHKRIALEFSHILTDGNGALHFLRALLAEYLRRGAGLVPENTVDLMLAGQEPHPEEFEDAFRRYRTKGLPKPHSRPRVWHLPQPAEEPGIYHITTGLLSLSAIKALAQAHRASLTEYLVAHLLAVFQGIWEETPGRGLPICVDVPADLRRFFPSRTLRNFFVTVQATIDPRLGHYDWEEILTKVKYQLRSSLDAKELSRQIARNVGAERHLLLRTIPFAVKGHVLPEIYRRMNLRTSTMTFSNLGRVTLPAPLSSAVERFDVISINPNLRKISCGCISFGDTLSLTFGRTLREALVERAFFARLAQQGCRIQVESNQV
jgi:NRPS condensation-like uncharacterized protein